MGKKPQVPAGYVARFVHWREVEGMPGLFTDDLIRKNGFVRSRTGGTTEAAIFFESEFRDPEKNAKPVVKAEARCSSSDPYNRRIGRDIALGRALKQLEAIRGAANIT